MSDGHLLRGGGFQVLSNGKTNIWIPGRVVALVPQELTKESAQEVLDAAMSFYQQGIQIGKREARTEMRKALGVLEL